MISSARKITNSLIGNEDKYSLAHRILNSTALIGIIITLMTFSANYILEFPKATIILPAISFFYFLAIYINSIKFIRYRLTYNLMSAYIIFVFIPAFWMINSGSTGGFQYFIFLFLIIIITTSNHKEKWFYIISLVSVTIALICIEYARPDFLIYYSCESERKIDLFISVIISMMSIVFATEVFMVAYKRSIEKLKLQKEKIQLQSHKLQGINNKLNELSQFKEDMTNMVIHDLKAPLNSVINSNIVPDHEERTEVVRRCGFHMLNLVQNVLDVYKADETELFIQKDKVQLQNIIKDVIEEVGFSLKTYSITLEFDKDLDYVLNADRYIIQRVIVNILSNAIKFSPQGSSITIKTELDDTENLKVRIKNQGPCISKEDQKIIFDRFKQSKGISPGSGSTGLGLTFCKIAIEAHKGAIGVISENEGAEFWFTLPETQQKIKGDTSPLQREDTLTQLSLESKNYLKPYITQLLKHDVYEIWEINKITSEISSHDSSIKEWLRLLENAVYSGEKEIFKDILNKAL